MDHRYPKCVLIKSIDFLLTMVYIVMASRVFGATIVICTYIHYPIPGAWLDVYTQISKKIVATNWWYYSI